jgi:ABC-2 type transport system permease protein
MYGFRRWFRNQRVAKSITILLFLAVIFAVGFAIYSFFKWEFGLFAQDAYLRVALPLFFYEGLFLVVFLLTFVSSFIAGIFALFRGGQGNVLVMASPKFSMIFWRAYRQTFFSSAWPLIVITIPAFLGSAAVFPVSFVGGTLFIVSALLLAGLATSLAIMLFFACACVLYSVAHYTSRKLFSFGKTIMLGVVLVAAGLVYTWQRVATGDITAIFAPQNATLAASRIDVLFQRFGVFPSHLVTLTLYNAQQGLFGAALVATLGLAVMFGLSVIGVRIAAWGFLPLWQVFQEGRYEAKAVSAEAAMRRHESVGPITFPRWFKGPLGAFFEKEGIVLFRGMKSALWFFFLFVLWMVQVVLEFFIRGNLVKYGTNIGSALAVVESLQLATAIYFVSAFILRFVFPAFSGEGKMAWLLGTAPIRMQSVFWSKFFFYAALFLALGVVFCGANFAIIQTAVAQGLAFVVFTLLMVIFLVALGLGLGAIFPNFDSDDPEVLSTSLPGLGFIFGSLLYGGFGAYLFYEFLIGGTGFAAGSAFGFGAGAELAAFNVLTVVLTLVMLALSLRSLKKFEFVRDY